ncbi:hypothetical protein [Hahella ganghwensis]|uniref:hypothetical protein n=1 Tax=Hahella ganghwensis TaxID=286420 RepID=UPI0012F9629C|nr:hypothetical protein [Hahella ganghwensis]
MNMNWREWLAFVLVGGGFFYVLCLVFEDPLSAGVFMMVCMAIWGMVFWSMPKSGDSKERASDKKTTGI